MKRALFVLLIIFADRLTKFFAPHYFPVRESAGFFSPALTALLLAAFIFLCGRYLPQARRTAAFYLIVGGALANIIDRLEGGTATDFINIGISTLNLADIAIMMGMTWLIIQICSKRFIRPR